EVAVADDAAALPAGPLYSVFLNGIRNGLESIGRAPADERGERPGRIEVCARIHPPSPRSDPAIAVALIEIRDDGRGFPGADPGQAFDFGYTTKPGSLGIGLALAREVVRELGGSIELVRRADGPSP